MDYDDIWSVVKCRKGTPTYGFIMADRDLAEHFGSPGFLTGVCVVRLPRIHLATRRRRLVHQVLQPYLGSQHCRVFGEKFTVETFFPNGVVTPEQRVHLFAHLALNELITAKGVFATRRRQDLREHVMRYGENQLFILFTGMFHMTEFSALLHDLWVRYNRLLEGETDHLLGLPVVPMSEAQPRSTRFQTPFSLAAS